MSNTVATGNLVGLKVEIKWHSFTCFKHDLIFLYILHLYIAGR